MKKIHILSVLCLIFFACNNGTNDDVSNGTKNGTNNDDYVYRLSSSSERAFSSSSEGGSSSSEIVYHPCKPYLSKYNYVSKDTLYFNKQGGIDTVSIGGTSIRMMGYGLDNISEMYDKKECKFGFESLDPPYPHNTPIMKMECSWFSITHISKDSVQVSVNKNETGKERGINIPLTGGGCALSIVDSLKIIQASAP